MKSFVDVYSNWFIIVSVTPISSLSYTQEGRQTDRRWTGRQGVFFCVLFQLALWERVSVYSVSCCEPAFLLSPAFWVITCAQTQTQLFRQPSSHFPFRSFLPLDWLPLLVVWGVYWFPTGPPDSPPFPSSSFSPQTEKKIGWISLFLSLFVFFCQFKSEC